MRLRSWLALFVGICLIGLGWYMASDWHVEEPTPKPTIFISPTATADRK